MIALRRGATEVGHEDYMDGMSVSNMIWAIYIYINPFHSLDK